MMPEFGIVSGINTKWRAGTVGDHTIGGFARSGKEMAHTHIRKRDCRIFVRGMWIKCHTKKHKNTLGVLIFCAAITAYGV